jgi:hypothetical protein
MIGTGTNFITKNTTGMRNVASPVRPMELVKINVVSTQPLQTAVQIKNHLFSIFNEIITLLKTQQKVENLRNLIPYLPSMASLMFCLLRDDGPPLIHVICPDGPVA